MEYDAKQQMQALYIKNHDDTGDVALQRFTYDERGNVISDKDSDDNEIVYTYNALDKVTSKKDKKDSLNVFEYDTLGNVIKVNNGISRQIEYTYNKDNQLIYKKSGTQVTAYQYDKYGNKTKEEDEYGYITKYRYDLDGNQISKKKPDGKKLRYRYNVANQLVRENDRVFTYDKRGNIKTAKDKQGVIKYQYDKFNQLVQVKDTNKESVVYQYDDHNRMIAKEYGDRKIDYQYDTNGNLKTVKSDDEVIASYTYNHRGEVVLLKQGAVMTSKTYDDMGRTIKQQSKKGDETIFDAKYLYDANDNVVEENINGYTNTYQYDEYDELKESKKYVNNQYTETSYQQDMLGNQIVTSNNNGVTKYEYNEKQQLTAIDSEKDYTKLYYDDNGNLVNKVHRNGENETYQYDIYNQLTQVKKDHYVYDYTYDASSVRTKQVRTDTNDYHEEKWYDYDVSLSNQMPTAKQRDDAFDVLLQQAQIKEANQNSCALRVEESYDYVYQKEKEITEYTVDRSVSDTQVLLTNEEVNVYGNESLLQSNDEVIIHGLNESVMASLEGNKVKTYSYQDYGLSKKSGYGYNGEEKDQNGLIYLRARYYDPEMARFIQIDNQYEGEMDAISTQNKYIYTLNNPYKYVDRDGLKAKANPKVIDTRISNSAEGTTYVTTFANGAKKTTFIPKKVKKFEAPPDLSNKALLNSVVDCPDYAKEPTPTVYTSSNRTPDKPAVIVKKRIVPKCKIDYFKGFKDLANRAQEAATDIWNGATKFFSGVFNTIGDMIKNIGNIDWWKNFISQIDFGEVLARIGATMAVAILLPGIMATALGTATLVAVTSVGAGLTYKLAKSGFNLDKMMKEMGVDNVGELIGYELGEALFTFGTTYSSLKIKGKGKINKNKVESNKGDSGANKTPNTEIKTDWYVGPDGIVTKSLDAYQDYIRMKGMTKDQIVNQIINGERIGSGLKDDIYHRSASFLSKEQLMNGTTRVFGGKDTFPYVKLETSGILNDIKGSFEYIINGKGQVTHQLFKPN